MCKTQSDRRPCTWGALAQHECISYRCQDCACAATPNPICATRNSIPIAMAKWQMAVVPDGMLPRCLCAGGLEDLPDGLAWIDVCFAKAQLLQEKSECLYLHPPGYSQRACKYHLVRFVQYDANSCVLLYRHCNDVKPPPCWPAQCFRPIAM